MADAVKAPRINGAEHAWVIHDPRFPIDPQVSSCPGSRPDHEQSAEDLIALMAQYGVERTVISHVCYYGRNNDYAVHCVKTWPERFAAIGLLVGHRLFPPADGARNASRLEELVVEGALAGLRLSPIYDRQVTWFNDPVCDPLWEKAAQLGATFNVFLGPEQIGQVADMAARHPGVKVVIDHFAMIDIARPEAEGFAPLLALHRLPNVYLRTSLHNPSKEPLPYRDMWPYLERAYDAFGPQRLVWANFHECLIMAEMIPFFTSQDREWILGKTAQGLYFGRR